MSITVQQFSDILKSRYSSNRFSVALSPAAVGALFGIRRTMGSHLYSQNLLAAMTCTSHPQISSGIDAYNAWFEAEMDGKSVSFAVQFYGYEDYRVKSCPVPKNNWIWQPPGMALPVEGMPLPVEADITRYSFDSGTVSTGLISDPVSLYQQILSTYRWFRKEVRKMIAEGGE